MPARNDTRTVQIPRQTLVENLIDKRTLPGARNTGHTGQHAKRKLYVDFFQIVLLRTTHLNPAVRCPPYLWHRDPDPSAQVGTGDGFLTVHQILRRTGCHNMTTVLTGSRSDIHDKVRRTHCILVMLNDNQRVAEIPQTVQRTEQLVIIPLMQSDARLIQNVRHTDQTRANLRRQTNPLRLSAG